MVWFEIREKWWFTPAPPIALTTSPSICDPVAFFFRPGAERCVCWAAFLAQSKVKQALLLASYIKNCHFARPNLRSFQLERKNLEALFFFKNYVISRHFKYLAAIYPPHNFMDWFGIRIIQRFPLRSFDGIGKFILVSWQASTIPLINALVMHMFLSFWKCVSSFAVT